MKFTGLVASVLAVTAAAAPNAIVQRQDTNTTTSVTPEQIKFAIQAAECDGIKCAEVVAAAACIAGGIFIRKPSLVLSCVKGGAGQLCGCAGCVDALGNFLTEHGIC